VYPARSTEEMLSLSVEPRSARPERSSCVGCSFLYFVILLSCLEADRLTDGSTADGAIVPEVRLVDKEVRGGDLEDSCEVCSWSQPRSRISRSAVGWVLCPLLALTLRDRPVGVFCWY